jgi:large subunit ribosomal protein L21
VIEGQTLVVDRLPEKEGSRIKLDRVLLLADGAKVTFGKPYIDGARVMAIVKENGKGDKIIIFKYKSKVRYRRKNGHRQLFTSLDIDRILPPGTEDVKREKPLKKAQPKKAVEAEKKAPETVKPEPRVVPEKMEAVKPVAKAPTKKTTAAKPATRKAPAKKTEEKPDGA